MSLLVAVLAVSACSSNQDGNETSRTELFPDDLRGVWTSEEDQFTLDFRRDAVLLFSSGHFEKCESTFNVRATELEVDMEFNCSERGVEYQARWALALGRSKTEEPIRNEGQSIGNSRALRLVSVPNDGQWRRADVLAGQLGGWDESTGNVYLVDEDESSTVSYAHVEGMTFTRITD